MQRQPLVRFFQNKMPQAALRYAEAASLLWVTAAQPPRIDNLTKKASNPLQKISNHDRGCPQRKPQQRRVPVDGLRDFSWFGHQPTAGSSKERMYP